VLIFLVFSVRRGGGGGGEGGQEVGDRERSVITEICTKRVFSIYTEISIYYRNLHKETIFYLISNFLFNTEISIYYKSFL